MSRRRSRLRPVTSCPVCWTSRRCSCGTAQAPCMSSNVCTHRGNILVKEAGKASHLRCGYHSRRFDLAGHMTFMPEFQDAMNFPSADDDLPAVPFDTWAGHGFAALDPAALLMAVLGDMAERLHGVPVATFRHDPVQDRDYSVHAHWALYVENYLEGFQDPFVHAALNEAVDYASYTDERFRYLILQRALARPGEPAFEPSDPAKPTDASRPFTAGCFRT